jgi:hypothetical protein
VVRLTKRRPYDQAAILEEAGDAVNHTDLERRSGIQVREKPR